MTDFTHPIRRGAILRTVSEYEQKRVEPLLQVHHRYLDIDGARYEYELSCPTLTGYYRYPVDHLEDSFEDTGLTNDNPSHKAIEDDEIRELYQELCDHSWHAIHDRETGEQIGEGCIHCKARKKEAEA
jgi:hypothetical protein